MNKKEQQQKDPQTVLKEAEEKLEQATEKRLQGLKETYQNYEGHSTTWCASDQADDWENMRTDIEEKVLKEFNPVLAEWSNALWNAAQENPSLIPTHKEADAELFEIWKKLNRGVNLSASQRIQNDKTRMELDKKRVISQLALGRDILSDPQKSYRYCSSPIDKQIYDNLYRRIFRWDSDSHFRTECLVDETNPHERKSAEWALTVWLTVIHEKLTYPNIDAIFKKYRAFVKKERFGDGVKFRDIALKHSFSPHDAPNPAKGGSVPTRDKKKSSKQK